MSRADLLVAAIEGEMDGLAATPVQTSAMLAYVFKDHEIAQLVNELRNIAVEFHAAQQLRERISRVVLNFVRD